MLLAGRRLLYINDTVQQLIRVFEVQPDGTLGRGRMFASGIYSPTEPGVPDGMKCDAQGNVWVCAPGGVWVYAPDGALIGKLRVPELVGNLTWGGQDCRTLFLTATHSVYAVDDQDRPAHRALYAAIGGAQRSDASGRRQRRPQSAAKKAAPG